MKNITALTYIPHEKTVLIKSLAPNIGMRRRLLDLGFISGNEVTPLFSDFGKNITAYRINGAIIALRNEDAKNVIVENDEEYNDEQ